MTRVGSPATDRENDDAEIGEVLSLKLGKRDVIVELDHIQYTTTVQPDAIFARDKNLGRVHDPSRKTRGVYDLEGRRNLYDVAPEDRLGDLVFTVAGRTGPVLADMMMFEESFRERMIIGDDEKGGISKATVGKYVHNSHHTSADEIFPGVSRANGQFISQPEA